MAEIAADFVTVELPTSKSTEAEITMEKRAFVECFPNTLHIPIDTIFTIASSIFARAKELAVTFGVEYDPANNGWGLKLTQEMLLKGANPTATKYGEITATELARITVERFGESPVDVLELDAGAGWAIATLYRQLPEGSTVVAVDRSLSAIACSSLLLDEVGIPVKAIASEQLGSIDLQEEEGVILVYGDFTEVTEQLPHGTFHAVYSAHGTAYMDMEDQPRLFSALRNVMKEGATYITDSLIPEIRLNLNKIRIALQVILGKVLGNRVIRAGETVVKNNEITALRDGHAVQFTRFLSMIFGTAIYKRYKLALDQSNASASQLRTWVGTCSIDLARTNPEGFEVVELDVELPPFVASAGFRKE